MIVRFILMLVLAQPVVGLMCYFCSDTSSEEGRNQCQTYYRTMRYYGKKARDTGSFKTDKYVKNCTGYGEAKVYCMVASIEARDSVRSFIRDCSDGTRFISDEIDVYFPEEKIKGDNQTTCKYTGQGDLACVTICGHDYDYGDFCNGPNISSASTLHASLLLLLTLLKLSHSSSF